MNPPAFYRPLGGDRFTPTESCFGPWFADAQHVGPPTALLVRAIEHAAPADDVKQLGRVTVDVLGVVPAGELQLRTTIERAGRTIELVGAEVSAGGRTVLRARAWRLMHGDTAGFTAGELPPLPPLSETVTRGRPEGWLPGYLDAVEWRWLRGGLDEPGPGAVWARLRVPVVEGEEPSSMQRLAAIADSSNGIGAPLDITEWLFLNTELSIHLHRAPTGEWVGVDAVSTIGPTGMGTVSAALFDGSGHVGRCAQQLTVRPRAR